MNETDLCNDLGTDTGSYEFLEFTVRVGETQISCGDRSLKKLLVWDLSVEKK